MAMWSIEKSVKFINAHNRFNRVLDKIRIISAKNGALKGLFTVTENEANEHGMLHGGFSATAIDVLTGLTISTDKEYKFVSVEMNYSFIESAKIGDEILIDARMIRKGKRLAFLEAELRNYKTNNLLQKGSQVAYLLDK